MNERLTELIKRGGSPYLAAIFCEEVLGENGFEEMPPGGGMRLLPGKKYCTKIFGSTVAAFTIGKDVKIRGNGQEEAEESRPYRVPPLRVAASHLDSPCLMIKPEPDLSSGRYDRLNVSVYGGPIFSSWLDRPLSIAGRLCLAGKDPFSPESTEIDFCHPVLTIPSLPIHLNRDVNKGTELNPQVDLLPLLGIRPDDKSPALSFKNWLAKEFELDDSEEILHFDLCCYNCEEPVIFGRSGEMISSPRLDNLTSVEAGLDGILAADFPEGICVSLFFNNEEIGSSTKQGAASPLAERLLERIYCSLGYSRGDFTEALMNGLLLSMDVAHAVHPNHPEKYDAGNRALLNDGVVLKTSVSQSYATDPVPLSIAESLCRANHIPHKVFANRSDIRGGSTLGSIASCGLNMPAVDVGIPILAMHSARELCGSRDTDALSALCRAWFGGKQPQENSPKQL